MAWIFICIGVVVTFGLVSQFRFMVLSRPLLRWFKASQPEISVTERDVLESGNIWVERTFFDGTRAAIDKIIHMPASKLSADEQSFLDNQVAQLCSMLDDWAIIHELHDLPPAVWDYIKQHKFWGLIVDKAYGGLAFSAYAHSQIITKLASKSFSAALTVMVPNSLGPAEFLSHYGTQEQKDHYLPRLVCGEELACFGLTSLDAGSDATAMHDIGVVCEGVFDGKPCLGIRLNFAKRYITLAPVATLVGLAFKLSDPEQLLGKQTDIGITLALVPTHLAGVEKGGRHDPMGHAFMNGPIAGKDVFIPLAYVIGGRESIGQGWRMLMECLSIGRSISLPSLGMACAAICYRMSSSYALLRRQFHRPIGDFEGIQLPLAAIGGMTYMIQAMRLLTLEGVDQGLRPAVASAITKYGVSELARKIVNDAMDIHGGRAIQDGPRNYLARLYSAVPICITVEGANILTRCLIIYGQGALRCHPFLQHEIDAAQNNDIRQFDRVILRHMAVLIKSFICACISPFRRLNSYEKAIKHYSLIFSLISDITMMLAGKQLKFKEALSGRLADILSYLYIATATLKYFTNNEKPESEQLVMRWSLEYCLDTIEQSFIKVLNNYPCKHLGKGLRWLWFRKRFNGPSDVLSKQLANFMQTDRELRERLTSCCYIGDNAEDPCFRVEHAWQLQLQAAGEQPSITLNELIQEALKVDTFYKGAVDE